MTGPRPSGSDHRAQDLRALFERATESRPVDAGTAPPARYALRVAPDVTRRQLEAELRRLLGPARLRVEELSPDEPDGLLLTFPERVFTTDAPAAFALGYALAEALPGVELAEPDLETDFYPEPDRSARRDESTAAIGCTVGPQHAPADRRWSVKKVRAPEAWAFSKQQGRPERGQGIVVAQPDTGVAPHREIDAARRVRPYDVIDRDRDATDPLEKSGNPGHGTGTGSVVVSDDAHDIVGSAPAALHMPIRCARAVVMVSQVNLTQAIDVAVRQGAHVITMSLGGPPAWALGSAVRRAVKKDVIVLAAAGNCVRTVVWPARYDDCIAVAGINVDENPWKGSCRGAAVDWSAPAENVYRARPDFANPGNVGTVVEPGEGTSFAVATTAGVAACWLAHHGRDNLVREAHARGETLQAMFRRLVRATARRPAGWDATEFGAGILDALALLQAPLDLDLGREAATMVVADDARPVRTLVAERLGAEAVDHGLDYERYGPELAYVLLREAAVRPAVDVVREGAVPESVPLSVRSSKPLRDDVANPILRAHLESLAVAERVTR